MVSHYAVIVVARAPSPDFAGLSVKVTVHLAACANEAPQSFVLLNSSWSGGGSELTNRDTRGKLCQDRAVANRYGTTVTRGVAYQIGGKPAPPQPISLSGTVQ